MIKTWLMTYLLLISSAFSVHAQDNNISWINKNARPLQKDTSESLSDLDFLSGTLKDNTIFAIGEASHGTREFYNHKKRIIEYLILHLNYKSLGFEISDSAMEPINQYLLTGTGDLKNLMKGFYLYNTTEIYDLFQFIRVYNKKQAPAGQVQLFGFDRMEYAPMPLERDQLMAQNIIVNQNTTHNKTIIWAHNVHIAKDTTMAQYQGMGYHLNKKFGNKLYALGFDTYKGSVNVINGNGFEKHEFQSKKDTFSALFASAKYPDFFIAFNGTDNPLKGVISKMTNIYANWTEGRALPVNPGSDFDGMIFIRESHASALMK